MKNLFSTFNFSFLVVFLLLSGCVQDDDMDILPPDNNGGNPSGNPGSNTSLPDASFIYSTLTIKARETIRFEDTSTGASSIRWTFEGGNPGTSSSGNVTVQYNSPGNFTAKLKATNSSGSDTKTVNIIVQQGPYKVAYSVGNGRVKTSLMNKPEGLEFIRYSVSNNNYLFVSKYKDGYDHYIPSSMCDYVNAHWTNLNPATWVGKNNSWVAAYGNNGFKSNNIPSNVRNRLVEFNNNGETFKRIDQDSDGNFMILTSAHWWTQSNTGLVGVMQENAGLIKSFAFGKNRSWVAIGKQHFWYSGNVPSSLKNTLQEINQYGYELIDVEMGEESWVIVYR